MPHKRYVSDKQRDAANELSKQRSSEKRLMQFRLGRLLEKKPDLAPIVAEYWRLHGRFRDLHNILERELYKAGVLRNFNRVTDNATEVLKDR